MQAWCHPSTVTARSLCGPSREGFYGSDAPVVLTQLFDLCAKKLLVTGWVGIYTDEEKSFRNDLKPPSEAMIEKGKRAWRGSNIVVSRGC